MATIARTSPRPSRADRFDESFDIVIVGGGGVGLATACFSAWLGNKVLLLEKAPELGGTTTEGRVLVLGAQQRADEGDGPRGQAEDCLRYMARLSRPEVYDPSHPRFGMSEWEYEACAAIYDNASTATELLAEKGALEYRHCPGVPDYWAELPEDKAPTGRVLVTKQARDSMSDGGVHAVRTMAEAARKAGVDIRTGHRVQRDDRRTTTARVVGVEADNADGKTRPLQGAEGRDLRDRRLHPRRRASQEPSQRAGARRLRGAHQRGRLRPHRLRRSAPTSAT